MTQLLPRLALLALVSGAIACGTGAPDDVGDDDDGTECYLGFSVDPVRENERVVGEPIAITAYDSGGAIGFADYEWTVTSNGESIAFEQGGLYGDRIELTPTSAGVYEITLDGSIGGLGCSSAQDEINVHVDGARSEMFVLRVVPGPGGDVPAQDRRIEVFGGAPSTLGDLALVIGGLIGGRSSDAAGDAVPAYLRAWPTLATGGAPLLLSESTTGPDGAYSLRLLEERPYELLVVPVDRSLAPYAIAEATPLEIPSAVSYLPGEPVTGTVVDGADAPVVGATVSLVVGGVPSSIATTDETGGFALEVRAGASVSVFVSPPDASGLPRLELVAPDATLSADGAVHVAYSAGLSSREVAPAVREVDEVTPAPGARVTWIARPIDAAGTITIDDDAARPATGLVRRTLVAGEGGAVPATLLPEAIYDVLVDPPAAAVGQAVAAAEVDLGAAPPAALALAAPAELRGRVLVPVDTGDEPLAGVRIQAAPRGLVAAATAAGAAARTDDDGRFALAVAGGSDYEITADATALGHGRLRWLVTAPAPGGEADLEPALLPRVLAAIGHLVTVDGDPVPGALLQVFCSTCATDGGADAVAETMSDAVGAFQLVLPDPGVAPE